MPRKKDPLSTTENPNPTEPKGKSFRPDTGKFTSIAVNESHTGEFMGARTQQITDLRSKVGAKKDILVIKLRDVDTDEVKKIACAHMLVQAWEDVVDEYGNGDESVAINKLRGTRMTINRGPDEKTKTSNNVIGTYEIIVWED